MELKYAPNPVEHCWATRRLPPTQLAVTLQPPEIPGVQTLTVRSVYGVAPLLEPPSPDAFFQTPDWQDDHFLQKSLTLSLKYCVKPFRWLMDPPLPAVFHRSIQDIGQAVELPQKPSSRIRSGAIVHLERS